jgi:hypothetical protein
VVGCGAVEVVEAVEERGSVLFCLAAHLFCLAAHCRLVTELPPDISRIRQISNTFEVHEAPSGSRLRWMRQACEVDEALVEGRRALVSCLPPILYVSAA